MISAILILVGGALSITAAEYLSEYYGFEELGFLFALIGGVMVILGLICLYIGMGLWNLKSWAWTWAMIANILSIVLNIVSFSIPGIIIPLIIVIYLNTPDIKSRFK